MYKLTSIIIICFLGFGCASTQKSSQSDQYVQVAERQVIKIDQDLLNTYLSAGDFSGAQLRTLAIEKEVIPPNIDYQYFKTHQKEQNSAAIWLVYSRKEKIDLVDSYKRIFKLRGATISNSSEYYVDKINSVLYHRIKNDQFNISQNRGIINIIKTAAILDGDYADGRPKIVVLRQWIGDANLELYKKNYPNKYAKILQK